MYRLEALDVTVLLEGGKDDVEEPESEEAICGDLLAGGGTAQLTASNLGITANKRQKIKVSMGSLFYFTNLDKMLRYFICQSVNLIE